MISRPSALSSATRPVSAVVGDGLMRVSRWARNVKAVFPMMVRIFGGAPYAPRHRNRTRVPRNQQELTADPP